MPIAGPYYLHWTDPPDPAALRAGTAFDPTTMNTMDEYVESYTLTLKEGDKPTLDLVIRNPHIGLLNSSRKQWAWFARFDGTQIVPLFCGRLIAAPKGIFKETIEIQLVAWPTDYFEQRQKLAEQIKASGPYDAVFIEETKRDDPDTILEAVAGLWHVDPVTHVVSISDIVRAEDGNVVITQNMHLYEYVDIDFDQTNQLTDILMVATVGWNQTGQGFIPMGGQAIATYAGDAVISDWPKPLTNVGGGYIVASANAIDVYGINTTVTATESWSYTNTEKVHNDGDTLSAQWSITVPSINRDFSQMMLISYTVQTGLLDPFAVDGDGDPSPINIPEHSNFNYAFVPQWLVSTSLTLMYRDLQRQRTERLQMLLHCDSQSIIVDPLVTQDSEVIVKQGADVSLPILNLLNWTSVEGQAVELDTIVFPDNPSLPSQRTAQICVVAGTAGTVEPNFSDVPGDVTIDNTVHWASLGSPSPTDTAYDWTADTNVPLGEVILPRRPLTVNWKDLIISGLEQVPSVGTQVGLGTVIWDGANYHVVTLGGISNRHGAASFGSTYGAVGGSGGVQWTCLGPTVPDGKTHFLCVQSGKTGPLWMIPPFDNVLHAQTPDNGVVWAAIGTGDIPIGGTPGDTWGRTYFDTARGRQSIEYLVSILRARGLMKMRAVTLNLMPINPFSLGLTCRKSATVYDTRVAGGVATGKIVTVKFSCDGNSGHEGAELQVGCCIGKDNVISGAVGTNTYSSDYAQDYTYVVDSVVLVGDDSDVGYTPPSITPSDDGLVFPLDKSQVVISEAIRGDLGAQGNAVGAVLNNMKQAAILSSQPVLNLDMAFFIQRKIQELSSYTVQTATTENPRWYDCTMKPLTGLYFSNECTVQLTDLTAPRGIDITGASTP